MYFFVRYGASGGFLELIASSALLVPHCIYSTNIPSHYGRRYLISRADEQLCFVFLDLISPSRVEAFPF